MAAVVAGQNEIGTGAVKIGREQQLRVSDDDVIGWDESMLITDAGRSVTPLPRKRNSHSPPFLGVNNSPHRASSPQPPLSQSPAAASQRTNALFRPPGQ